jgi:branched-chain amino acid transport system permease protein
MNPTSTGYRGRVLRPLLYLLLLAAVVSLPSVLHSSYWMNLVNLSISFSIACLGLNIVLGYAGQLSLAQAAFWGVGAYTSALLTTRLGMPVLPAMVCAFLVAGLFGILLGIPTLKLSGHYLAMATIGFGIILQIILINAIGLTGGSDGITAIPSPRIGPLILQTPQRFFYFAALVLIFLTWAAIQLKKSRVGRALQAIRGNEMAAETAGIDTTRYKITAFALSAAYAGLGGALFAHSGSHYISPDTFSFDQSVIFLAMAVLGGNGSALGSIVGATLLALVPEVLRFLKSIYMMVYGAGIVAIIVFMPGGIASIVASLPWIERLREQRRGATRTAPPSRRVAPYFSGVQVPRGIAGTTGAAPGSEQPPETLLAVNGLAKHFGGLKAVDGVDMQIRRGEIHALIGPNGSGKTTILNMLSGLYAPTAGVICLGGAVITGQKPHIITAHGMARTFQNIRLFGELSVMDNVLIGQHCIMRAGFASSIFCPPSQRAEEEAARGKGAEMLRFVGLGGVETASAGSLPYGRQRLLELARALASSPRLLLLDEPAAGLNPTETASLVELLFQIRETGVTILLVEHDMSLVMNVSDRLTVLNFGRKIAEGTADVIERNQEVIDAYLGTEVASA